MKNIAIYTESSTTTWKGGRKIKTNFRTPMWDTYKEFITMYLHDNQLLVNPNDLTLHSVKIYILRNILKDWEGGNQMNQNIEFTLLKNNSNSWEKTHRQDYRYVEINEVRFQQWLSSRKIALI